MKMSKQQKKLARRMELLTPKQQWALYKKREFFLDRQREAYARTGKKRTLALIEIMEANVEFLHKIASASYKAMYPKKSRKITPKPEAKPKKEFTPGIYKRTRQGITAIAPPGFSMGSWGI